MRDVNNFNDEMAETFLSYVIRKLDDLLTEKVSLLRGVHREVNSLKDELEIIQSFLVDAEKKLAIGEVSDVTKVWLKQMRKVAEHIEDVIGEYLYHLAKPVDNNHHNGLLTWFQKVGNGVRSLKPRYDLASEIRDINESLKKIKERGISYGLRPFEQQGGSSSCSMARTEVDPRLGSLFVEEDELVGIDSTSKELITYLVNGSSMRSVISLVGQGGIGKTTLARKVYGNEALRQHFECFAWISVSQSYNLEKVLTIMRNQICPTKDEPLGTLEELMELLRLQLQIKRYVIVFDDVWDIEFWGRIKHVVPSNNKGSRIIITTRNTGIANDAKDTPFDHVQELKTWSLDLAWELFRKKAFRFEIEGCCSRELEQLSYEILRKCHGLPLVIATVASLFSKKEKTKLEWRRVLDNLNNEFEKNPHFTSVSKILSFSYDDLPYHLKSCFLYFGLFPQDYSVSEHKLCNLWIAEDFIKAGRDKSKEQVAGEYLNELIHRNLVSFEIKDGVDRACRVHDLIHDVILTRGEELCFFQIINEGKLRFEGKSRRLAINNTTKDVLTLLGDNSKIRSVFLFDIDELVDSFVVSLFKKFKFLKVLDFEDAPLCKLPKEVGNLFNLKYINLRGTKVKIVPKSIGNLRNLETLNLYKSLVEELPIEIKKLQNLQHLAAKPIFNVETDYRLDLDLGVRIQEGIGSLEQLQTLVSLRAYPSTVDLVKELEKLRKLKILCIRQLTAEIGKTLGASIENMNNLVQLYLHGINEDEIIDLSFVSSPPPFLCYLVLACRLQQLPDWISKLQNLQGLNLKYSRLTKEPLNCLKQLPNLAFLEMCEAYNGEELCFEEKGFKKLKHLVLRKLEGLKVVKIERGALPLLEKLEFGPFPLMIEMPCDIQFLTNLKSLEIMDMSSEFVDGLQPEEGSHYWKVQHVPYVTFWYKSKRDLYDIYKLGESDLLKLLLQEKASSAIVQQFTNFINVNDS
ncbi:disease resistance protein RPM1-like [Cannabis sativa]|uniref:disease resistance protein RPM1-like n=1 Tax=Cannabis sativa TaxID=3483 RepID=UPI0029CA6932|nr:disease resistance protein RPM1-like [Cannabis sativa]